MFARHHILLVLVLSIVAIFSVVFVANAQQPKTCPMIVADSLTALGTNCASLERNTTCYGHETVQHTAFTTPQTYDVPGTRIGLPLTETIQTGPFNLASEKWGLNVMSVNANLPYAIQPKRLVYIQFGGVEVENGVPADEAVSLPENGVSVTTASQTNLLTWPSPSILGHASDVITSVPAGAAISLDAINPAGDFVRAVFQNQVGWMSKSAIDARADLSTLVTIGPDSMTPMQSFYFRTGVSGTPCVDAPSLLYVQGPNNVPVDIQVFQKNVRIESTVIFRSLPPGDTLGTQLEIIVLSGLGILNPDTPSQIIVPPGFKSTIPLCADFQSLGTEGDSDEKAVCGEWSSPVPLTQDELDSECHPFEGLPDNTGNYPITCPIVIQASGIGQVISQLSFPPGSTALNEAIAACGNGSLPPAICQYLGIM